MEISLKLLKQSELSCRWGQSFSKHVIRKKIFLVKYVSTHIQYLIYYIGPKRNATGNYRTYSIPDETAALVSEFAVEDLPSAELQPRFLRLQ